MKKFLNFVLLIAFFFFNCPNVEASSISTNEFIPFDEVTIKGNGFNNNPGLYEQLCFDDKNCFSKEYYKEGLIKKWTDDEIVFTVPAPIKFASEGYLKVYAEDDVESCIDEDDDFCYWTKGQVQKAKFKYKFLPYILGVNDKNKSLDILELSWIQGHPNTEYIIEGFGFENKEGDVSLIDDFGNVQGVNILEWKKNEIKIKFPEVDIVATKLLLTTYEGNEVYFDFEVHAEISNDKLSYHQKYLLLTNIPKTWESYEYPKEVVVAVIDDGVYHQHADLNGKMWKNNDEILGNDVDDDNNGYIDDKYGWNFVENNNSMFPMSSDGHGTAVAAIIAADRDNSIGLAGIASNVKIMPLISCSDYGCHDSDIIGAIQYAADKGAHIINLSIGSKSITSYKESYDKAIQYAWDKGVTIIIAAGNGDFIEKGIDTTEYPMSPVCNETKENMIIGVGASTDDNKYIASWSNYGNCVDVYAPGEKIITASIPIISGIEYKEEDSQGTSFSAPIVSGILANVISAFPNISNEQVTKYLLRYSKDSIIDAYDFMKYLEENFDPFKDDASKSQYVNSILDLRDRGIIRGYDDGTFRPFNPISRAEFMKIVMEVVGSSGDKAYCFDDIKDEWYAKYVCYAKDQGIISGVNNLFLPNKTISVAESLKIIFKALNLSVDSIDNPFNWHENYVNAAKNESLFLESFNNNIFREITREEMAELLYRIVDKNEPNN